MKGTVTAAFLLGLLVCQPGAVQAQAQAPPGLMPDGIRYDAGGGAEMDRVLDESVILVVAALNPDGHARRIDHSLSFLSRTVVRNGDHAGHDLWASQRAEARRALDLPEELAWKKVGTDEFLALLENSGKLDPIWSWDSAA